MKMRVANVIEDARLAGPQRRIANVARALHARDVDTVVFLPDYDNGDFISLLKNCQVPYVVGPIHRLSRNPRDILLYFLYFGFEIFWLSRSFRREAVDIVHVSGGAWQIKGLLAARLAGKRTVWHLNDTGMPRIIVAVARFVGRFAVDGVIFAGGRVRDYYSRLRLMPKVNAEIQAPVDTAHFASPESAAGDGNGNDLPLEIVSVAHINPLKGIEYLVEAAGYLKRAGLSFRVSVIGQVYDNQRRYHASLQALKDELGLDGAVAFVGAVADVVPFLAKADVYVCSSVSEASPTSVWEAMSMGLAVVSTDVGDVPRILTDGVSGYVVPCRDARALAKRIHELAAGGPLRARMGREARRRAVEMLDISVVARQHDEVYTKLLSFEERSE
jgi:glycosyltransferase involved in cell wall biosynthesis